MPLPRRVLAAALGLALAPGPALAAPPGMPGASDPTPEVEPSPPGRLPPGALTVAGALSALPMIGLPLFFGFRADSTPFVLLGASTLGAGHFYAGDPVRGLLYGLGGYAAVFYPIAFTMEATRPLTPPSPRSMEGLSRLVDAIQVGMAFYLIYAAYGAWDANETERRVLQARQTDRLSGEGQPRRAPPALKAIGASVGAVAGTGLTCARELGGGFGLRVAGLGWPNEGQPVWNLGGALTRDVVSIPWGGMTATLYGVLGVDARSAAFPGGSGLSAGAATQLRGTAGLGLSYGPVFLEGGPSVFHAGSVGFGPAFGSGLVWRF